MESRKQPPPFANGYPSDESIRAQKTANKAVIRKRTRVPLARATVTVTTYILKGLSKKGGKA